MNTTYKPKVDYYSQTRIIVTAAGTGAFQFTVSNPMPAQSYIRLVWAAAACAGNNNTNIQLSCLIQQAANAVNYKNFPSSIAVGGAVTDQACIALFSHNIPFVGDAVLLTKNNNQLFDVVCVVNAPAIAANSLTVDFNFGFCEVPIVDKDSIQNLQRTSVGKFIFERD